jgi:hypothetical protein
LARKGVPLDARTQGPPCNGFRVAKGRSKLTAESPSTSCSPHTLTACGRRDRRASGSDAGSGETAENSPRTALSRRDNAQVVQDGPPRLVGYGRISTDDQTTALQADVLTRAAVDMVFEEEPSAPTPRARYLRTRSPRSGRANGAGPCLASRTAEPSRRRLNRTHARSDSPTTRKTRCNMSIRLRAHHLLCILTFAGKATQKTSSRT